jgi:ribosomal protein L7/L12
MPRCSFCDTSIRHGDSRCPSCGKPVSPSPDGQQVESEVLQLLRRGRKLEAIKLYKNAFDCSLLEAKNAVESLATGPFVPEPAPVHDPRLEQQLLDLLRRQRKIQAIKLYKEATGVRLMDAKQAVEALASRHGVTASFGGGVSSFTLLFVGGLVLVGLLFLIGLLLWTLAG